MNNVEIITPENFETDPVDPPKRRKRTRKSTSHILRVSTKTKDFCWPGEDNVVIARRVLDRIKSNPPPASTTIHEEIAHLNALLGSVEVSERPFFLAHAILVLDIAISEQLVDLDQGNTYFKKILPKLKNKTIEWWRWDNRRSFRAMEELRTTCGNCAYAIYLHSKYNLFRFFGLC